MASRRQKQFDRKYSSYRKYTSTNDVNYSTHSSRSSYRSESLTSREDGRGRSTSSELISGSETRSYPVYIAIQDYSPDKEDIEGIPLEQGQIVEVLDKKNSVRWLVRTKARPPRSGWVPGSYFETPTEFYKQRRRTREIENVSLSDEQAALVKRDQVYHELLRSEEEFVSSLRSCVDGYIKVFDDASVPDAVKKHRDQLVLNIPELYNFHANVMLKGLNYYSDDPGKVGQTFVRLEKDFESHVEFYKNYNQTLQLLQQPEIDKFLQALSNKNDAGASTFADHINEIADRMVQYQNYFKEFVKYSARVQGSSKSVQKALELVTTIPQRVQDLKFINNIRQYPGDTNKLGRIIRHDAFQVWEGDEEAKTRYVFLFRNKMMFTEQKTDVEPSIFIHYSTIRLDKYNIREHTTDETIILQPKEPGLPHFRIKPKDLETSEYVKKAWLKDVGEEQELYAAERDAVSLTATSEMTASSMDLDVNVSDAQSEFSEWSGSRKSSLYPGPEEGGPPRKKVKSPPVISPTGSSASIYSGGSSSIDWTTTGTTLEMQGTRVTRTQYGFRTLQESSAKMCLKVTGYPLPDITWYKDDVLLSEDERHTFYSDEDGFFAMTIDPVQVTDTGRYTCMATNEYGQASTSAFFRVLKVEKEAAPPAFVTKLQDKDCKEGDVIDFECEVEGWPEPELVWLVDDQPLRPSQDFRLQYDGQTAKLEIRDAQPDDTGVYTVKIQNEFGSSESKAELFVEADPDKNHVAPEFQATIEDVECNEGDEVRFKSVITGDPNPEITWLINGVPLSESEKVKFISEDGICILTIKDVTRHFDGLITCQGSNRLGTSTCDAQLKIRIPPAPPAFNKPLEDKTVQEKSTVSFEIDVTGWPKPIISITLAGKELKNGEDGTEITGQDGFYRITIPTVSIEKHDGEIIARAQNEHGTAESRARLTVDAEEEESRSAPTFIKDIEDQTVKSGELAIFETSVRGNPNPEVTWFVNGHKMDSSSPGVKIEAHNHDHKLTIDSAQYAGTVLCRAENAVGRFETKARLVVLAAEKPKRAPKFTEVLTDKTEVVENHLTFEVRVEGEPKPTVTWYLNGNQIQQSEHFEIREFDGSIKLQIKNLKFEDAGEIKAVATNSEGSDETKATIVVQKKPFAPEFDLRPATQTVEKGSEAIFKAHAFGIPIPTYSWSINGRKVREGQDGARVSTDGIGVDGASILTIDTATYYSEANQLTISVVAENSLGAEETGAQLIVEPKKAAAPIITRDLQSQTVNKSELAHFEVVVENATSIQWFHNGTPISSSTTAGVKLSNDDQFEFRASLDSNCFENGTVSIRASNESGQIETKADLIVLEPPKETKKPEFTDKLKDVEVIQGDDLQMDVIALNSPEFKWFQNGNELENGKNGVEVINNENKSTLIIRNAQASGIISVEASNQIGKAESSGKLTVKPPATVPIIVDGPKSMKVKENERVEFSATINGYPEPTIKWLINDRIVEESTKINASRQENVYSLSISNVATEDGGKIKVTAQNSAGSDSKEADLVVEPNVSAPRFKNQLIDKIGDEGEPLRWNIEVENPTPGTNLKWFLNGKPLEANDQLLISDNGKGVYSLTIADAKPDEHNGQISAKVKNESGEEAETTAKVEIKPGNRKPEFVQKPQNHETTIEESVKFSAIVSGKPMPNVSWYLNDRKLIQSDEIKVKYVHESGKTSIRIHKPLKEHNGIIRIVAENVAGKVEATAELKVDKKFEVPKIITNMDDRQVKEGENVKYTTSVEGYPEPTVEWKLNGEPVNQYPNITVTDNQSGEHTIEIIAIQPEQAGELSCEATNSIGTKKRDVQLAVKKVGDAPTFAKNLEDQLITEGEATVMSAKLNPVKPKPKVQWLKDGVELKADDHLKLIENDDGSLELNIASTKLDDKGRITIKAENDFGVAECAASLGVVKGRPMAKPVFQSSIPLISLTEGESLECKLLITGDPTPFVKWYIEGQLVCATEDTEITNANGVYTLKIHGVTSDMTGKIKCVAYNKAGEASTEGQLKVVAPIPVEFETSLCDATCREGDTLKLKAVLLGEPEPVVSWYVNGKKLEESQNIKIHAEKGTYTVTIKDITCDYSGQVVCEAVNEYGKATSEATLLVLPRGEPPDFIEWLSNVRARTGSKVVHKVVFTGDPKPTLTWYINNAEIRNSNDYSIVTDDKTSVLTINNFNADVHVGEIICKAENDAGEVSCTANMLTYTSDMFSESESEAQAEEFVGDDLTEDESFRDEMHRTPTPVMAPKFITKIKDAKTKKGHSAVFECVVPDTKGVCCKWLKDGKEIELIARIRVKTLSGPEGHVAQQLIIDDVEEEDAGKYTCIVENSSGADKCEATLTVVESFDKAPNRSPEFIVALQDKTTKTSEKVLLECKAIGEPRPNITWYHDDKIITSNETTIIETVEGVERVTISSSELKHQGKYTCVAENSEGTTKTESFLTVQGEAPQFTKELQNKEVSIGEKLILSCSVKGTPQPHVEFYRSSEATHIETKLVSTSRIAIEHDQSNTHWRMVISEVQNDEICNYKAIATNSFGSTTSMSKITSKIEKPVIEQGLKTTTVKESEELKMEVKVGGKGVDVDWFKDGQPIVEDTNQHLEKNPDAGVYAFVVEKATRKHSGYYTVKARNSEGEAESGADVEILEQFKKPIFVQDLIETRIKLNETSTLSVIVEGVPEPVIDWLKDGRPINIDSSHIMNKLERAGHFEFVIKNATLDDSGIYTCRASNPVGEAKSEANLTIVKDLIAPEFVEKLVKVEVKENETAKLAVKVIGTPKPTVQWLKDDQPINIDGSHLIEKEIDNGSFVLTINQAKLEDVGTYSCKARNEAGDASTSAHFGLIRTTIAPEFTEKLKPLEVEEKASLSLNVTVTGTPQPTIEWFKDDQSVNIDGNHLITKTDGNGHHSLIITSARSEDVGVYSCKATNEAGEAKTTANIGIQEDIEAPLFIDGLKRIEIEEGKDAELKVKVEGKPEPKVEWFKDEAPLQIDNHHLIVKKEEDGVYSLIIKNTTIKDFGKYSCKAINKAGKDETIGELQIPKYSFEKQNSEETKPLFIEPLNEMFAKEGDVVILKCKINKESQPTIKFYKNDSEVVIGDDYRLDIIDDGSIQFTIRNAKKEDVGAYKCEALNQFGKADTVAQLTVQYGSTIVENIPDETGNLDEISPLQTLPETASSKTDETSAHGPPEFIELLRSSTVVEKQQAILRCRVKGEPTPKIRWTKNGKEVEMSARVRADHKDDGTLTLTLDDVTKDDAGEYKCEAKNDHGNAWTEGPIIVTLDGAPPKTDGEAPDFLEPVRPAVVNVGETARLEGKLTGKPKPTVKWYKNGEELKPSPKVTIENLDDGTQRLTIKDAQLSDQDEYRCSASNEFGDVWSDVTLNVKEKPTQVAPEFFEELQAIQVKETETATFECKISGTTPNVRWFKEGNEIKEDSRIHFISQNNGLQQLIIEQSKAEDQANYRIEISNESGTANSKAPLTVIPCETLKIKRGLNDVTTSQGSKIILSVEVEGKPKTVKWYKGSETLINDDHTRISQITDTEFKLEIEKSQIDDNGSYRVVLSTGTLSVESSANVIVTKLTEKISLPSFKKGLADQSIPKGSALVLEVEIDGKPNNVKWYKNGKEVSAGDKPKIETIGDGKYRLTIPDFTADDVGNYSVTASNEAGEIESRADVSVKDDDDKKSVEARPEIVSGLIPININQGETARFNVKVKGAVKSVKWLKNGNEIPDGKSIQKGDGEFELEIPNAQLDDNADYKVVLSNDAGDADSSARLTVKLPQIKIVKGLKDQEVPKGSLAVLEVETNQKPKSVKWYKNGKEIDGSDKAKPGFNGDNKPQLLIPDSSDVDAADYKIVLTDDDGNTADSSCSLCVKLPAEQPKIIKGLEDQTVAVGSPIKLEIETSGSPKSVKWLKNGKEVAGAAAAKIRIQKIDDNNYVLEIPASEVNDSGDYKVEVSNEAGADNSSAKIIVEPKITFIKPLKDQTITESETGEFLVETNTQPKTIKWYKNGQEIQPDSRILLQQINDTKFSLIIKNSTRDDAAVYKVVLSNSAGDAETSATLTVNKAKAGVCRILKGLDDQIVAKGAAMVFEVKIEGEAEDVRWLKNGSLISPSANAVIEKINDSTYRLTIPSSDVDDAGEYTVEVVNSGGKVKSNASGEVDEKPEIVRQLQNLDLSEGDDDVFKVEVNTPIRNVKWYKNGQEIEPTKHLEPKKIGPKKYELKINRALLDDAADYKVILSNKAGECDSSASLTVTKPNLLKILDGLKDVEVDENQPINLKVKIDGIPKTVKWYKNGQEIQANDQIQINENPETGEYSLLIPSSKRSDGGPYRVVLTSDKNEVYSGSVAHVKAQKPKEPQSAPNFISPLKDCEVEEGDILTLQCIIGGQPFPDVKWLKDGVEILKDDRISMRSALDGTTTLRIRSAKKSDIGRYEVVATNDLGSLKSDCSVNVKDQDEQPAKPKFVIPLRTCSALPGEKKEFHVKIRGTPKPTLKWFLNNQPIEFDDRILIEDLADGNYCLTIKEVQDKDFGTIRCVATNEHGSDETIAEFEQGREHDDRSKDDLRYPPRFNVPLWDRRIPVGDPMFIECHVDANPTADIEWFKDGVKIQHSSHIEIRNTIDGACRLKIIPFDESDCGSYKCVAINDLGQAETQSIYSVEVVETVEELKSKEYAPRINPGLEDQCVTNGSAIHLSCKVDAIPRASVVWYKDGLPLRNDSRISINYNDDGTAQLSIQQSIESDIGAYRCVATNAHGTTNTSCSVNVKVTKQEIKKEGEEPFFTKGLADLWTDRGETFTLKCAVVGDPKPDIKWYRNGQLIRNGPRTLIETTPDGVCTLIVKDSTMSDEGIYRCEAENAHGKAKTQATAHVQMALGKTEKPKIDDGKPPKFILELSDTTVSVGSLIDIECKVTGQPIPTVKWSKDGGPLIEDSRFEWSNDEAKGVYQLRIKKSTIHDEGTYRCVATNENGSATTKSFIRIDDGIGSAQINTGQAPRFTLKLGDVRAVEGQPLKLECKIEANPLPEIVWYKDGAIVEGSERIQISLSPDGVATLTIPSCVYDDDGIYRIIATNPNGTAQDKGTATVKKLPKGSAGAGRRSAEPDAFDVNKAPKLIEPLENVRIPEKQGFKLRCKFSGDPKPTIKWFKDGERVFPYGRLQLNELPDGVCELIIDSSIRQDSGGYRCVAENTFGSARTSADVNIIRGDRKPKDLLTSANTGRAPGFTIPLTIRRAKPNESVTFECLPFGQPFPSIKWLKDGLELMADDGIHMESADDGTQRLILSNVSFLSEGYYRCVATNEHGTASTKAELIIEGDRSIGSRPPPTQADAAAATNGEPEESKPRIRRGLYNMSIHEGNVVEMIVCATGWPTPTVKWFKDGEEVISDGADGKRLIFTDERGIHHLVIVNANSADEGEYSLEATNKLGSAKTEGSLNIILPRHLNINDDRGGMPFPPGFVRQLKNKHVFNRMPTIFDCLVVGHPAPDVEWFHNGKKIVQGGRIKIQSCGGGSHALIILDTTLDDAGEYVAVAKNSHGTASSSAVLDVTVPFLDNIKFNGEIDVTPYLTEEYGFKKLNTASLPTPPDHGPFIKEVTGHYLTLSWIPTKRAPPRYPQVTYVIEIRQLPEKEWTLLDYNIPEPVCKVRNLELGKSYQFRVRAENIYGISDPSPASPPSRLMAPPQPVFDRRTNKIIPLLDPYAEKALELRYAEQYACAPWFAPGVVEKRYCAENDTLTIVLNVSGYPDPEIVWKFRGWDIDTTSPTSKLKIYTYGGSETTLVISGFTKENVGQYQCFAKNEYGEAQQNVLVELATLPKFIQQLSNKTFSSAHPLKLDVRVEGDPFPELKWMKEWRPIVESSRIKFVQDGPYLCSLIINDPMWRDSGIYSCVASNDAGQTTTSCTVTVEAEGDYNDVEIPRRRVTIESRKVRELYEITEADEKLAAEGAPFCVTERATARRFLAQLRPIDDSLLRHTDIHNSLDHPGIVQMHRVLRDQQLALVVFDNANSTIDGLSSLTHPGVRVSEPSGANRETCVRVFVRQLLLALQHMHSLRIAHLDLRPETILLQDDKLKLADFGQSRRLLRGLITGEIKGSPEFVSPEIVRSLPLTLATDMWSTGVLTYVLLTGLSPFHGDNDNETLANVDRCEYEKSPLGNFSFDASDFVQRLLLEIPAHRMTVDEALNHPWINDEELKNKSLSADTLREFQYQHKWLTRRVFVQQTPSEQILEAILSPQNHRIETRRNERVAGSEEGRRPAEIYEHLRVRQRDAPHIEEVPPPPPRRQVHPPFVDEFGELIDSHQFDQSINDDFSFDQRRPPRIPPQPQRSDQPAHDSKRFEPLKKSNNQYPSDQYGRPVYDPRSFNDPSQRPTSLEDPQIYVDKFGHQFVMDRNGQPHPLKPEMLSSQNAAEKRKLMPQDKGETPSRSKKEKMQAPHPTGIPEEGGGADSGDIQRLQIPLRMIRGERREIEEEIANRILSDISEEGSIAGSLASLEDFEIPKDFQVETSEPSTPTLTPEITIRETIPKSPTTPTQLLTAVDANRDVPSKTVSYSDRILSDLPEIDRKILEQAENDPSIPVGAPLFLEGIHGDLTIDTTSSSGLIKVTSPALNTTLSPKSPRRSTPGTKSPVILSPRQEHSMEVLIATKRGKPGFLPPGELAPEIDDEDAFMDKKKKTLKPKDHDDDDDFKDEKDKLVKDKNRRSVNLNDLDKYRPSNYYKDDDDDLNHAGYDIDDSPWDSHYQIGPDTYLMAARGAAFNSRVRNYRSELFGVGAPLVRQGFLGVRNRDITVRERRRYTDILRETTQGVEPKKTNESRPTLLQKNPSSNAIDRIKADIEKVAPSATRKNEDGTFAPIFTSRLRDVYLRKNQPAIFECSVSGSPQPNINWEFQGRSLKSDDKILIENDPNSSRLTILKAAPYDLGEYVCSASNEFGIDKTSCRLISGETPSRPGRPDCELSSDTELLIQWEAPEGPTYLEGITYRLEYRPAGPDDHSAPWITISDKIDDESVVVKHLSPLGIYQFRVTAQNGFGFGVPSLSSRIVQTHGKGAPKLQIDVLKKEIRLNVVSMPQKSTNQLGGITEESEEDLSMVRTLQDDIKITQQVETSDPTGRFQIAGIKFKGKRSIIRDAVDSSTETGAHCVVKIRHPSSEAMSEYQQLRDGQHENVQKLIATFDFNNFLFIFTEKLYEDVFSRFVFNDYYTEEQVAITIRQLTAAIHFLHFRGIAHLDVNPHNIMFQSKRSWIVKLIDFGRAQRVETAVKPLEFDTKWAPPEFHIPETSVTVQSDVWGMGVVTFCLLAGFHPFTSEYDREDEIKENVINVKCDPNLIPVNASQECLSFSTWALKKSPLRRMRTDEALSHKFLSSDPSMVRRRESIRLSASRLRKLAAMIRQPTVTEPISEELEKNYGN